MLKCVLNFRYRGSSASRPLRSEASSRRSASKLILADRVNHHHFGMEQETRLVIFEYIEGWYNRKKLHSTLGYITPCQIQKIDNERSYEIRRAE